MCSYKDCGKSFQSRYRLQQHHQLVGHKRVRDTEFSQVETNSARSSPANFIPVSPRWLYILRSSPARPRRFTFWSSSHASHGVPCVSYILMILQIWPGLSAPIAVNGCIQTVFLLATPLPHAMRTLHVSDIFEPFTIPFPLFLYIEFYFCHVYCFSLSWQTGCFVHYIIFLIAHTIQYCHHKTTRIAGVAWMSSGLRMSWTMPYM